MKFSDFNEKKQHGTVTFPVEFYHLEPRDPRYIMQPHWHKEFEIMRVVSGEFNVYLNGVPYSLHSGDIIFVECGTLHRAEPINCVYECVVFDLNFLRRKQNDSINEFLTPIINGSISVNRILNQSDNIIYATTNSLFSVMRSKEPYYELDVYSLIMRLFSQLYKLGYIYTSKKEEKLSKQAQTVIKILDWIDENLTEPITLQKISEISGLNEKYICRIFKEYTSKSPINYINELRIEAACYDMTVNKSSVTKAAYDSGFNDLSYFSKTFKRIKGVSPKNYCRTK